MAAKVIYANGKFDIPESAMVADAVKFPKKYGFKLRDDGHYDPPDDGVEVAELIRLAAESVNARKDGGK